MVHEDRMNKYRNKPIYVDEIRFASKAEAKRYGELKLLEKAGEIADLKIHPAFYLTVNGIEVCKYVADFAYWVVPGNRKYVVEDVKGVRTRDYQIKKKLMLACLAINVEEVMAGRV